jgi:hypothetical protein
MKNIFIKLPIAVLIVWCVSGLVGLAALNIGYSQSQSGGSPLSPIPPPTPAVNLHNPYPIAVPTPPITCPSVYLDAQCAVEALDYFNREIALANESCRLQYDLAVRQYNHLMDAIEIDYNICSNNDAIPQQQCDIQVYNEAVVAENIFKQRTIVVKSYFDRSVEFANKNFSSSMEICCRD